MRSNEFIKEFKAHYRLDGLMDYARCSGRNLYYKKVLIYILRTRFRLSFPAIAKIFRNNHATIIYHFNDVSSNMDMLGEVDDAWKLYRDKQSN